MGRAAAWTGGIGAAFGITCCVTPLLPVTLSALGAGALVPVLYRDAILLPFSAVMLALMIWGIVRMRRTA